MRISDWSSAVCSSDLELPARHVLPAGQPPILRAPIGPAPLQPGDAAQRPAMTYVVTEACIKCKYMDCVEVCPVDCFYEGENMLVIHPDECIDCGFCEPERSEEHTSELQSLMRISYAVFCLKQNN